MPSSVQVGSRVTSTPGVYTTIDASALNQPSPTAVGIVALIGEAVGGAPYTSIAKPEDIAFLSTPAQLKAAFPAGDLFEAGNICFAPSDVTGGAQQVVALKANPSTQAQVTLQGGGGPVMKLLAQAWGLAGNGITASVGAGSVSGVSLTLQQGSLTEFVDNLGNDPVAQVSYDPSRSWDTLTLAKDGTALSLSGQAAVGATPGAIGTSTLAAASALTVHAQSGDLGKTLTVYGVDASGNALVETVALRAASQATVNTYAKLLGAELSDTAQEVDLLDGAGNTLATLGANVQAIGMVQTHPLTVANAPVSVQAQEAQTVLIVGTQANGAAAYGPVATSATHAVASAQAFTQVTKVAVGALAHGVTLSASAARVPCAGATTVAAAALALRAVVGVNSKVTSGDEQAPLAALDPIAPTQLGSSPVSLLSDLAAVIDWVNAESQLCTAVAVPGAASQPSPTANPVMLSGGTESPAAPSDYQACLDLLKQVRVNLVVPLTSAPAVQAMAEAHCSYMCGVGQSERLAHVGAMDDGLVGPASKAQVKAQAAVLNSGYCTITPNTLIQYDSRGNVVEFPPHVTAAAHAGMRAGARVNTPLTRKGMKCIGFGAHPSIDPIADSDELINAGVTFMRRFPTQGVAVVRDITTWTRDNNPLQSSTMVAYATGINVFTYRTALETFVGQDEFSGGFNQIYTYAVQVLTALKAAKQIYDFDPPTGNRQGDVILVDQSWQFDPETNFILATIRLTNPQPQQAT